MPPPPQGGYQQQPYGQQPYQGQPPYQGQQPPYGQQPQQPYGQQQFQPQQPQPQPQRPRGGGGGGSFNRQSPLMKVVTLLIAGVIAGVWWYTSRGNTTSPASNKPGSSASEPAVADDATEVGDCMANKGSNSSPDMETVDCSSAEAEYKVTSMNESECAPGESEYQQTRRGRVQYSLCMEPITPK
ncbi:hypothetical protein AB0H77_32530 [Streptomyces sp. NPDC050844]|uniref:LppU/SCO3897 family protein n=1 Tax=Streptomyces sp. NPDC050844 TaxID=3155790 RepID=UPI0033CD327C